MNTLTHKGYVATIDIDEDSGLLSGLVLNVSNTTLHFAGHTVEELKAAFADTIADYLGWCKERGKEPEKPYSGNFMLRLDPDLHRRVAIAAAQSGKSLNGFVSETLEWVT